MISRMRKGFKIQPDLSLKNVGLWDRWWSQVKNLPANAGTWVPSRSRENSHGEFACRKATKPVPCSKGGHREGRAALQ